MSNQNDPRVKRTRQLIRQSFWELMKAKGFDSVTVQDIAREATVNRATFYAHYADKYAVLDEIAAIAFQNKISEYIKASDEFTETVCRQYVALTYDYIISFYRLCKFGTKSFAAQIDGQIKNTLYQSIKNTLKKNETAFGTEITAIMISSAIYSAAYHWYTNNGVDGNEQLPGLIVPFIMNGLRGNSEKLALPIQS